MAMSLVSKMLDDKGEIVPIHLSLMDDTISQRVECQKKPMIIFNVYDSDAVYHRHFIEKDTQWNRKTTNN